MSSEPAGLLRRFAAILYDSLLVAALLIFATLPFIAVRGGAPVEANDNTLYRIILLLVTYAFFVGFWTSRGRTLGMQSWRLQLESADGGAPSFSQTSIRFVTAFLSWLPAGLGFLWQIWDRDRLCWHDRLSGTRLMYHPKPSGEKSG